LSQTLFELARQHIGALVVLEGRERLDDLLVGGTELDGLSSDALLRSIFDPSSVGHDGAVLLRGGRVARFACHLPLSTNIEELQHRGTRHAAALGLSERSDALVLVVSEERGTVTVAEDGHLKPASDAAALEEKIAAFEQRLRPERNDRGTKTRRFPTALAALVIAVVLWVVLVYGSRVVQRSFVVPLDDSDLAPGFRLASMTPKEVRVTLSGPRHEFFFLDAESVHVTLPLRDAARGRAEVRLDPAAVTVPGSLNVKSISPSRVVVTVAQ
jgi:hypothetical protein